MGLRSRASTKGKGRAGFRMTANGEEKASEEAFDYPPDGYASRVGISVSIRRSENYQSVALEVWAEVPCHPGTEVAAGEFCAGKCSEILKANEDDLGSLLESLI